jgi:hypothetical protein
MAECRVLWLQYFDEFCGPRIGGRFEASERSYSPTQLVVFLIQLDGRALAKSLMSGYSASGFGSREMRIA